MGDAKTEQDPGSYATFVQIYIRMIYDMMADIALQVSWRHGDPWVRPSPHIAHSELLGGHYGGAMFNLK